MDFVFFLKFTYLYDCNCNKDKMYIVHNKTYTCYWAMFVYFEIITFRWKENPYSLGLQTCLCIWFEEISWYSLNCFMIHLTLIGVTSFCLVYIPLFLDQVSFVILIFISPVDEWGFNGLFTFCFTSWGHTINQFSFRIEPCLS